jgi:hypothetical protein
MVTAVVAALAITFPVQQADTATFRDGATAELYAQARVRHIRQDSLVRDYRAAVQTRMDLTAGRSRFARQTALFAHETVARVTWRAPNDLKVEALGVRSAAPIIGIVARMGVAEEEEMRDDFRQEMILDRPWFIPRAFGDSIRLMGVPDRAAVHPFAAGATSRYRYAITDSVTLIVPGRTVRAVGMRVEPKRLGPSLVAGEMWLDRETADVVRMVVVFVGEYLWEEPDGSSPSDSADARDDNEWANRFLTVEADVEYALVDGRYWLPHRQFLAITAEIPWFVNAALPARAVSTFSNYEVNTSPMMSFVVQPDELDDLDERSTRVLVATGDGLVDEEEADTGETRYHTGYLRAGNWDDGHWEVVVPPAESLLAYDWQADFRVALDAQEQERLTQSLISLANISEELPPEWIGRRRFHLAWERFADVLRYNRVQGSSVGIGVQWRPGPDFTTLLATGRFGLGDLRPSASLVWRREDPAGRLDLTAFGDVQEVEPWTRGSGVGNTLNAALVGHDDADYYFVLGTGFSYTWNVGFMKDVEFAARFERHETKQTTVDPLIPGLFGSATFRLNPAITEGTFFRTGLNHTGVAGPVELKEGLDVLAGDGLLAARAWGSVSVTYGVLGRGGRVLLRGGVVRGDEFPQLNFRLGGPQTVRGYPYGTRVAREFWSAQMDYALRRSAAWTPVVFADVGDTFSSDPIVGAGLGVSLLNGLIRLDLSKGLRPSSEVRLDLAFRAHR